MQFKELDIIPEIRKALEKENYEAPTPIQEQAIPVILEGRDLLGCAQTGTGKTAAFAIPTLQLLSEDSRSHSQQQELKALIITPTRELALQIDESFRTYGRYTNVKCCVIFGGVSQKPQEEKLLQGVDILVATPGRLKDFINQKLVDLSHIKICILDEADRMLDMGFIHDVKQILAKTPAEKQTLLFSATMPPDIASLSAKLLKDPVRIEVTPVSSTVDMIDQYLYYVDKSNKKDLLLHILKDKSIVSALVFSRTKHGADRIVRQLSKEKVTAQAIHGDKSQGARQTALSNFKDKKLRILVATDIAARGIDIDELSHVINYDLPDVPETYVHRIGRTGRAGLGGVAISFCDFDEQEQLADIEKLIGKELKVMRDHPYPLMNHFPAVKNTQSRRNSSRSKEAQEDREEKTVGKANTSNQKARSNNFAQTRNQDQAEDQRRATGKANTSNQKARSNNFAQTRNQEQADDLRRTTGKTNTSYQKTGSNNFAQTRNHEQVEDQRRTTGKANTSYQKTGSNNFAQTRNQEQVEDQRRTTGKANTSSQKTGSNNFSQARNQEKTYNQRNTFGKANAQNTTLGNIPSERTAFSEKGPKRSDSLSNTPQKTKSDYVKSDRRLGWKSATKQEDSSKNSKFYMANDGTMKEKKSFFKFPKRGKKGSK